MTSYERVTFRPEGARRSKTVVLESPVVGNGLLTGVQVNAEGDEVAGRGFDEVRHVISLELVLRRVPMRMDNIYGQLVEVASA